MQPGRLWVCLDPSSEDFCGLPNGAMQKQLRAPGEIVLLAGIEADSLLVFLNGGEGIAQLLIEVTGRAMEAGLVANLQEPREVRAGRLEIAGSCISRGQITFIALVRGIGPVGGFEQ